MESAKKDNLKGHFLGQEIVFGLKDHMKRAKRKRVVDFVELEQDVEYNDIQGTDFEELRYLPKK